MSIFIYSSEKVKEKMAFIIKKKRYKFQVELTLNELTEVSFGKAILFAKVRQLEGGNFQQSSKREEVENHMVRYNTLFSFPCKMSANSNTGVLDSCKCRVSIRKEEKGGKNFRKIGFGIWIWQSTLGLGLPHRGTSYRPMT